MYEIILKKMKSEEKKELRHFWESLNSDVRCKNSNICLADPLSVIRVGKIHESQIQEMM